MSTILTEHRGGVLWLTLNRPHRLNAIDVAMRDELWQLLDVIEADETIQVVVFRGAGERAFSSGADLHDFGASPSYVEARRGRTERDIWGRLLHIDKPLIAALHGYVLGAGLELALCCDFRIAEADALLGLPEVGLGYLPSAGGTQTLPRLIGPGRALELILTGDPVTAAVAFEYGIVQRVVDREALTSAVDELASRLSTMPPAALRLTKQAVVRGMDLSMADGLRLEARLGALVRA